MLLLVYKSMFAQKIKFIVRQSPLLYFGILGWRRNVRRLRADPTSELVVEAFPRSANTSSVYALVYANGERFKIGHHLHVAAHVKYAAKHQIPCLVIMRNPIDCVASLMVMRKDPDNSKYLLMAYVGFSKAVEELLDHLVVVSFDDVVNKGLGFAINAVNRKFGASIAEPSGSNDEKKWVANKIKAWNANKSGSDPDRLSMPTSAKREKTLAMHHSIRQEAPAELLRAEKCFARLINHAIKP